MRLQKIHAEILSLLVEHLPEDPAETGEVSRKVLLKSVNHKPRQIEKACDELEEMGLVRLHAGFHSNQWASISITDKGIDQIEPGAWA